MAKKPRYFSDRVIRLLTRQCVAQEIGPQACWMLTVIVQQQRTIDFARPVTYSNPQLMPLLGFKSQTTLIKQRQRAIDAGWLRYQQGSSGVSGVYEVTIPDKYKGGWDGPVNEFVDSNSHDETQLGGTDNELNHEAKGVTSYGVHPEVNNETNRVTIHRNKKGASPKSRTDNTDQAPSMVPPRIYYRHPEGLENVTDDYLASLQRKYPGLSVHWNLERMNQWFRKKVNSGETFAEDFNYHGFIVNWLQRETANPGNPAKQEVGGMARKMARGLRTG